MLKTRRSSWFSRALLLVVPLVLLAACATAPVVARLPAGQQAMLSEDDDYAQLVAQLRTDLSRSAAREAARARQIVPTKTPDTAAARRAHEAAFAARARALFAPLSGRTMSMPVVGVYAASLDNSWHAPRDGGVREHKGIDIFAHRGTPVVAVTDGIVSFIGDQPKAGHCVWLTTEEGTSFFYAHLDRWAAGLYEGVEVQRGDVLGYVGNTGNARDTFPHLHFGINQNDEMVNPYPVLLRAIPVTQAHVHTAAISGSSAAGSR